MKINCFGGGGLLSGILAAVILFCLPGCSDSGDAKKSPGDTFTIGFECGFEPYGFIDPKTHKYVGFDIDLAREVARRNSWKPVFLPIDWKLRDTPLESGEIDCIWNGFMINGREELYEWSAPYTESRQVVITRNDSPIRTLADLAGKNIAVQSGSPTYQALTEGSLTALGETFNKIVPVADFQLLMEELASGDACDAIIADVYAAWRWNEDNRTKLRVTDIIVWKTHDGIAFRRGNRVLRDQVQKTLDEMRQDGTLSRIALQWFKDDISILTGDEPAGEAREQQ